MYIKAYKDAGDHWEDETYTVISNLTFNPSTDLVGASVPVNEFEVDIYTTDTLSIGDYVELYDDSDTLWASYWAIYAEHIDAQTLRIRGQSDIAVLDRITLPAKYYNNADIGDVLDETIIRNYGAGGPDVPMTYTLDSSFDSEVITGFCPEQTARERLVWICFVIGGYVKAYFNDNIEILPIDNTETLIPISDIYWKPTITYTDWVTAIVAKSYIFERGTPEATDTYVKDAQDNFYIVTETTVTLENTSAPSAAPDNVVMIEGVYLINNSNVSGILSHLSQWYFKRMQVDMDIIDNGTYIPADKVVAYADENTLISGYITDAVFSFGLQSKARIHLTAVDNRSGGNLIIYYMYETIQIGMNMFVFPVGYSYSVTNPYNDLYMNRHYYVFRPLNQAATGTILEGENVNTQNYAIALDLYEGNLHIISVDEVEQDVDLDHDIVIGVIS